jgi:CheY-like chemotaxis protein
MLEGDLRELQLAELLRSLRFGRKSGLLLLSAGEREARLHFEAGQLVYGRVKDGANLGEYLVRMDLIGQLDLQQLVAQQRVEDPHSPLGLLARRQGLIDQEQLEDALRAQIGDTLHEILSWTESESVHFRFEGLGVHRSQVPTEVHFDPEALLLETTRERDEWSRGQVEGWQVLKPREGAEPDADLSSWELLSLVDGRRSCASIAAEFDLPAAEIYHRLHQLVSRGLLIDAGIQPEDPAVLLLSSSPTLRRLGGLMLRKGGYQPLLADTPAQASEILAKTMVSLVILDEGEPERTISRLRSLRGRQHLPFLVLSRGHPRLPRGVQLLEKPVEEGILLDRLAKIVRRPR